MGHRHKHISDEDSGFEEDDAVVDQDTGFGPPGDKSAGMIANAAYERARDEARVREEEEQKASWSDDDDDDGEEDKSNDHDEDDGFVETVHREAKQRVQEWHDETWEAHQKAHPPQPPPEQPSLLTRIWRSLFG